MDGATRVCICADCGGQFLFRSCEQARYRDLGRAAGGWPVKRARRRSDDGRWSVRTEDNCLRIVDEASGRTDWELQATPNSARAFSTPEEAHLVVLLRGVDAGVLLFRWEVEHWSFTRELEGTPNQGVVPRAVPGALDAGDPHLRLPEPGADLCPLRWPSDGEPGGPAGAGGQLPRGGAGRKVFVPVNGKQTGETGNQPVSPVR